MTGAEAIVWWVVVRRGCRESGGLQGKWVVDVKRCTIVWLLRNGSVVELVEKPKYGYIFGFSSRELRGWLFSYHATSYSANAKIALIGCLYDATSLVRTM